MTLNEMMVEILPDLFAMYIRNNLPGQNVKCAISLISDYTCTWVSRPFYSSKASSALNQKMHALN